MRFLVLLLAFTTLSNCQRPDTSTICDFTRNFCQCNEVASKLQCTEWEFGKMAEARSACTTGTFIETTACALGGRVGSCIITMGGVKYYTRFYNDLATAAATCAVLASVYGAYGGVAEFVPG